MLISPIKSSESITVDSTSEKIQSLIKIVCQLDRRLTTLTPEVVEALYSSGLMTQCFPKFPREEIGIWKPLMESVRQIARSNPSVAWIIGLAGTHSMLASKLDIELQNEIFKETVRPFIATSSFHRGDISKIGDDYILNGLWRFSSGIELASHILATGSFEDNEYLFVVKPHNIEIVDSWDAVGLRGTGSKDFVLKNVQVKQSRAFLKKRLLTGCDSAGNPTQERNILPFISSAVIGSVFGCLQGAYDCYIEKAMKISGSQTEIQNYNLGVISATYDACEGMYYRLVNRLDELEKNKNIVESIQYAKTLRDCAYLTSETYKLINSIMQNYGIEAVSNGSKLQNFWKDIQVMRCHIDVEFSWNMKHFGNIFLSTHQ